MGLIAMVPNLLPVVLVLGCMGWFSIPMSVATVTVASIVFGIVVDDTIHFSEEPFFHYPHCSVKRDNIAETVN